ncbi:MAG: TrkH family potassium uptake protein [Ruminococcaceae bacterium]|nr:TrkH family potassium uptake protein [Oscillospiraceae bacterium]
MNYRMILYTIGWVLNAAGACMLLPLICAIIYGEPVGAFLVSIAVCMVIGICLTCKAPKNKTVYAKEGFTIVAFAWIIISMFGALPFFLSGTIPNYIDALFETVSGFTTTGASILTDLDVVPRSMLFWRSFTHWIGGMGVLVFLVAFLPLSGGGNLHLLKAESTGPSVSKLVPRVRSTAKILYGIYLLFTLMEILLLLLGGMPLLEALTITFGTVGTGGFGIRNSSAVEYSAYIQIVITIFMIACGVDFTCYYLLLNRQWKTALRSEEVRTYLGIVLVSTVLISLNCRNLFSDFAEAFRHSIFQVGSVMTTTGFMTSDFDLWPEFSKAILVLLMFVGACAGSTGGGIKVSRIIILLKSIFKETKIAAHPKSTHQITFNKRPVAHETVRAVNVFMISYLAIFAGSFLIISLDNFDFTTNFTAVAATMNNIGPGLAGVGPTKNFSGYSDLSTLVLTFNMLVGRLEIFPLLVIFSPHVWRR